MVQLNTTLHMRLIVTKGLNFHNKRRLQVGSLPVNIESIFQMEEFRLSGNQTFFIQGRDQSISNLIFLSFNSSIYLMPLHVNLVYRYSASAETGFVAEVTYEGEAQYPDTRRR